MKQFAPWKPVWISLRWAAMCAVVFIAALAVFAVLQDRPAGILGIIAAGALFVSFFGLAACSFSAVICCWEGALATCPKCGERFAGRYFASQCRACGFAPHRTERITPATPMEAFETVESALQLSKNDPTKHALYHKLEETRHLGSSGLEALGAIGTVFQTERETLVKLVGEQRVDSLIAFVNTARGVANRANEP